MLRQLALVAILRRLSGRMTQQALAIIIKPTLSCDISCRHCYHLPEERTSEILSLDRLDKLFNMVSRDYGYAWFIWHGGEPLTVSLSYYRKAIDLQNKHFGKKSQRVGNTMQTNGIGIDRRVASFFRDNRINLGISYEGPYDSILREKGDVVSKNIQYMLDHKDPFSVSVSVSSLLADRQPELYTYFRDRGINASLNPIIPCGCAAKNPELIPDPDKFIESSNEAFDMWVTDKDATVALVPHILYLMNALGDRVSSDCAHDSCLTKWICINPNGDLYPCGKKCPPEYRLCNIDDISSISDAFATEGFERILRGSVARREKCQSCEVYQNCSGGCSIDACYEGGITEIGGDSCRIFKGVFTHVKEFADMVLREQPDLSQYNKYVRDAILGKLVNPALFNI